jgi:hypothetical protein
VSFGGLHERQVLLGLYRLQHGRCALCCKRMVPPDQHCPKERQLDRATIDHMTPIARGGRDDELNRICACASCNALKGQLDLATFIRCRHDPVMLAEAHRRNQANVAPRWRQGVGNVVAGTGE